MKDGCWTPLKTENTRFWDAQLLLPEHRLLTVFTSYAPSCSLSGGARQLGGPSRLTAKAEIWPGLSGCRA